MVASSMPDNFGQGIFWNTVSFFVLGICGILFNILIGRFYGSQVLGIFNQVFALYIFLSQFAVFGLHFSVLKHVSEHSSKSTECNAIITSAAALAAVFASFFVFLSWLAAEEIGVIFDSPGLVKGWLFVLPGIWFFALNKVLLAVLNGFLYMRVFAAAQAGRYILMVLGLGLCLVLKIDGEVLSAVISFAELLLFLFLSCYTLRLYRPVWLTTWAGWGRKHLRFGISSFLSGTIVELNSRVDIIMLGLFVSDAKVGIYSMAAILVEGLAQLATAVRNNVSPLITRFIVQKQFEEMKRLTSKVKKIFFLAMFGIGVSAVACYPLFIEIFIGDPKFGESFWPFAILMCGLMLQSGYLPFHMTLIQAGLPGLHMVFMTAIICTNVILNLLLIPWLGIHGAAIATAGTFVLSAFYLKAFVARKLNFNL
jgi:O-antigen/teichoic acid export membrane protein